MHLPNRTAFNTRRAAFGLNQMTLTQQREHLVADALSANIHYRTALEKWLSARALERIPDEGVTSRRESSH